MEFKQVYARELEDGSGFVVVRGLKGPLRGGQDKWEEVLGLGTDRQSAIGDARRKGYAGRVS